MGEIATKGFMNVSAGKILNINTYLATIIECNYLLIKQVCYDLNLYLKLKINN